MPQQLVNGEVIYNVTAHDLDVWCEDEGKLYTIRSDGILNAKPESEVVDTTDNYTTVSMSYTATLDGLELIRRIRRECPKALIVGSVIAAQAYPEWVVAPIHVRYFRSDRKGIKPIRSNRFSSFKER